VHHLTKVLLWCGIIAPILIIVFMMWASAVTPNYSHITNTVSQLSAQGQPYPVIMNTGFVIFGLLINGFAFGLYRALQNEKSNIGLLIGLLVFGSCILVLGFVNDYSLSPDVSQNLEGHLHKLIAQISLVGFLLAMFFLAHTTYNRPEWQFIMYITVIAAIFIVGFGFLSLALSKSIQGLLQRGLYGIILAWIIIISINAEKNIHK
jgi:hypothetical protein